MASGNKALKDLVEEGKESGFLSLEDLNRSIAASDMSAEDTGAQRFCRGLRDQIGVLCDGTVVPCCLDHEGDIALGNLFEDELSDIMSTERAHRIYDGFSQRLAAEALCRRCGYSMRFT